MFTNSNEKDAEASPSTSQGSKQSTSEGGILPSDNNSKSKRKGRKRGQKSNKALGLGNDLEEFRSVMRQDEKSASEDEDLDDENVHGKTVTYTCLCHLW